MKQYQMWPDLASRGIACKDCVGRVKPYLGQKLHSFGGTLIVYIFIFLHYHDRICGRGSKSDRDQKGSPVSQYFCAREGYFIWKRASTKVQRTHKLLLTAISWAVATLTLYCVLPCVFIYGVVADILPWVKLTLGDNTTNELPYTEIRASILWDLSRLS